MANEEKITTQAQYDEAVATLKAASKAYYGGTDIMDDATYDKLWREIEEVEKTHPQWVKTINTTAQVAGGAVSGTIKHSAAMLSLDNVFDSEGLHAWLKKNDPDETYSWVCEPKLDGMALAARYVDGELVQLLTRGDGEKGDDVTRFKNFIVGLPQELLGKENLEVRGEVMLSTAQYEHVNALRIEAGSAVFMNERNGAAGLLRLKEPTGDWKMTFYAYQVSGERFNSHSQSMQWLKDNNVNTTIGISGGMEKYDTHENVVKHVENLCVLREELGYGIDGCVIKVDDYQVAKALGYTSRAPRWAIAFKYPAVEAITTLKAVHWQVGRTGVITPRAELEPVLVSGTTITYATLHNPEDIERKGFKLGDKVNISRAGDVIPYLRAPVVNLRDGSETDIDIPQTCPRCDGELDRSQVRTRCMRGRECGLGEHVEYACSRAAFDIKGLGDAIVDGLIELGIVKDVSDIFALTVEKLTQVDRVGEKHATKVVEQITNAKNVPFAKVVTALGIKGTGRRLSSRIANVFPTMEKLLAADVDDLQTVEGVGSEKAPLIVSELMELKPVIAKLQQLGVNMGQEQPQTVQTVSQATEFSGKKVCITGSLPLSRDEIGEIVERLGGTVVSSVSKNTDILLYGDKAGSKLSKAQSLGVALMDAQAFSKYL